MTFVPTLPTGARLAVVAIVDPDDVDTLDRLKAILPDSALHRIPLPAELEALARADVAAPRPLPPLTGRQAAILPLLMTNLSNKEIGRRLAISHFTVRNHVSQILRALDVPSRQAARAVLACMAFESAAR